jgi:hypothetical protein
MSMHFLNFKFEDNVIIKNKYDPAISKLFNKTISRSPLIYHYSSHLSVSVTASFFLLCQCQPLHLCPSLVRFVSVTAPLSLSCQILSLPLFPSSVSFCHCLVGHQLSDSVTTSLSLICQFMSLPLCTSPVNFCYLLFFPSSESFCH